MSKNVVDCVIEHKYPIGLIPSRRQVDFNGGYVNKWNTKEFSSYVKSKNSNVLLCRDHGGEGQGQTPDDGYESYFCDSEYFDLIHIDPFKSSSNLSEAAKKTVDNIKYCHAKNNSMFYEVGTEQAIFKYEPDELKDFLIFLQKNLTEEQFNKIKYVVIQSGTGLDLSTRTNIGNFNNTRLLRFIDVVKSFNFLSKEHNGDYLIDSGGIEMRFANGLDAINIAPEFGQIESNYYLNECKSNKQTFDKLYNLCYNSEKWKKWLKDSTNVSESQMIMTCCHYILSDKVFIEEVKSLFPEADSIIQKKISSQLKLLYEQTKNYCV